MLTREELERKFLLKNKIVVTTPSGMATVLKREKTYHYLIGDDARLVFKNLEDLIDYCMDLNLFRNKEEITEEILVDAFKLRDKIVLHKKDNSPIKVVRRKEFNYTLDNMDSVIKFNDTKSVVDFFNKYEFSL